MPLLSYADTSEILYSDVSVGVSLTKEQQSFCLQAVALFNTWWSWSDYADYPDEIDELVATTIYQLMTGVPLPDVNIGTDSSITVLCTDMQIDTGDALAAASDVAGQAMGFSVSQLTPANADIIRFRRYLMAGNWEYRIVGVRFTDRPILKIQMNDANGDIHIIGTHDLYGAFLVNHTVTGTFTLDVSGYTSFFLINDGKNALSSGYGQRLTYMTMWRVP